MQSLTQKYEKVIDIEYNFLVGGDGNVYVGRGWDNQGEHTPGFNNNSICIAFIGKFFDIAPPLCQLLAAKKLIEKGVKLLKISKDYRLYGQSQLIDMKQTYFAYI